MGKWLKAGNGDISLRQDPWLLSHPLLFQNLLFLSFHHSSVITYLREKKSSFLDGPNLLYLPSPRPSLVKPGHDLYRTKGCGSVGAGADRKIFLLG